MEIYTGIDIIEVKRIEDNICAFEDKFLNKIYTKKEIEYCESRGVNKVYSYAGKYAAKEAILKAISPLVDSKYDIGWKDLEILNDESGRPFVNIYVENIDTRLRVDVSIAHIAETAVASAIATI